MAFFGNSANVTTTVTKGNLEDFKAKQECKKYLGDYASPKLLQDCVDNKLKGIAAGTKTYTELTQAQAKAAAGVSAGSRDEWSSAWQSMQVQQMRKNLPLEDHSDPTPLLIDRIAAAPADSFRRRHYENLKNTIDGTAINVGDGLDNLTRESYRDVKRLAKQSEMIRDVTLPNPTNAFSPGPENLLGLEEGTYTTNLQNWRAYFANAHKPVSDAIGSHGDTDHAVVRDAAGPVAFIPRASAASLDRMGYHMVDETEGIYKSHQLEFMAHLPSKVVGCVRQLSTALDSILSVPFEIMSDVYNGLMQLINEIANLIDMVLTNVINWAFSIIGGLVDSIFPLGQLEDMLGPIFEFAGELSEIFDLFGGFPAMAKISSALSVISGGFVSILTNLPYLYTLFKTRTETQTITLKHGECLTEIFDLNVTKLPKIPGILKALSILGGVIGAHGSLGAAIGNLGAMISGSISNLIGSVTANVRNFVGLLANLLPNAIGRVLHWLLHKLCNLGMVGNLGFSIGSALDHYTDHSFSLAMTKYATHHAIVAPLFGKQVNSRGAYAQESVIYNFEDSKYVLGSQGNKGITMYGPGATANYKTFGTSQGSYFIGGYDSGSYGSASLGLVPTVSY